MSYMGKVDVKASDIKRFSVTGSTSATHVLSWTAPSEQALIITINGVKQQDGAYTISGTPTTITLSSALVATDEMEVIGINDIGQTNTVAQDSIVTDMIRDDAVTTAKIADDQITTVKIADDQITSAKLANAINITSGNSLTIDSGATITNNGTVSGFPNNTPAFMAGCYDATGYYNFSNNVNTKVAFNTELLDTDSAYDPTTNYRFTVPTGKGGNYFISAGLQVYNSVNITNAYIWIYKNGGAMGWSRLSTSSSIGGFYIDQLICERIFPLNAGDYIEIRVQLDGVGSNYMLVDTSSGYGRANWFCGWRLAT